ncbi:MAG: VOC family protein [Acidobacteriota bacterium]|nr:VOC family protein [Acidobacteriota bacterium]
MSDASNDKRIDYLEFSTTDIGTAKRFYGDVFGWKFEDYGPAYSSFHDGRMSGGFTTAKPVASGGPLVVIFATDLAAMEKKIVDAGGVIVKRPFEFPGGRRFHFADPSGNELAVWSDV